MQYCVLLAPLEKRRRPRRLEQFLTLPRDVCPTDHNQVYQFFSSDATVQELGIGEPRPKIPWTLVERKTKPMIRVTVNQFIHLDRHVSHANQIAILPNCSGMRPQQNCDFRRKAQTSMSAHQRRWLKLAIGGRDQTTRNLNLPLRFVGHDHAERQSSPPDCEA